MKKFSTAGPLLLLGAALASLPAVAQTASRTDAITTSASSASATATVARCAFLPNAPDQHKVVRGDTLWDISGKFLQHPWCWPQVWGLNRSQIKNPHWIYPGQIVVFDRATGRLRLAGDDGGVPVVKLSPRVRSEKLDDQAIPSIPLAAIQPFLTQPLIVEPGMLAGAPHIVAAEEGHVFLGKGERAYVRGDLKGAKNFQVFRPAAPLKDPETGAIVAYEAAYLGTLTLDRAARSPNEAHRFVVSSSKEEMGRGDLLVPTPADQAVNYVPHAPASEIGGSVMSIPGGVSMAGQNAVISLNRGRASGIDVGTVLDVYHHAKLIADGSDNNKPVVLPAERIGSVFVFRVFDHVSYALVMQVADAVRIGDLVRTPE